MAIANGSTILPGEFNGIWSAPLGDLTVRDVDNNPYRQWTETLVLRGITNTSPDVVRTVEYTPRRDVILRGFTIEAFPDTTTGPSTASLQVDFINTERAGQLLLTAATGPVGGANTIRTITSTINVTETTGPVIGKLYTSTAAQLPPAQPYIILGGDTLPIRATLKGTNAVFTIRINLRLETRIGT